MDRRCYRLVWCFLILMFLFALCGCTDNNDGSQETLFQDDFDAPDGGWGVDRSEEFERGYDREEYFIELHEPNRFAWARPGLQLDDVVVKVEAYPDPNFPTSHFGVLCRYVGADNFYYFAISSDGYYAIFLVQDGANRALTGAGRMIFSDAIRTDMQMNAIQAVCYQDQLSLYVNGELLDTVTDDTFLWGDIGLGAGSAEYGGRVYFDNFLVTTP